MTKETIDDVEQIRASVTSSAQSRVAIAVAANTAVNFLLGMACLAVLMMIYFAPFLLSADEVASFWRGIL